MKLKIWIFLKLIWLPFLGRALVLHFFSKKPEEIASETTFTIMCSEETDDRFAYFTKVRDIKQEKIEVVMMPTRLFQALFDFFFKHHLHPKPEHSLVFYKSKDGSYEKDKSKYLKVINRVLAIIETAYSPKVFLSASIGDARWRYMIEEVEKRGGYWIITEREGAIAPIVFEKNPKFVRDALKLNFSHMFVSNQNHFNYWKEVGVEEERLKVVGELKSDFWILDEMPVKSKIHKSLKDDKKLLLYFAFGNNNYIDPRFFPTENYEWGSLQADHYRLLVQFVRENPSVQVVLKGGHPGDLDLKDDVKNEILEYIASERIVVLSRKYKAIDLIRVADVIWGLQTTALIESMFTKKPIVYAGWGSVHDEVKNVLLPLYQNPGLHTAENYEECLSLLRDCLHGHVDVSEQMMKEREKFRSLYFYKADGQCHVRLLENIVENYSKVK